MYAVDGIAARDKKIDKIDFIEDCDDEGNTSLHYAVQNGKRRVKYRRPTRYKSKSITRWGAGVPAVQSGKRRVMPIEHTNDLHAI